MHQHDTIWDSCSRLIGFGRNNDRNTNTILLCSMQPLSSHLERVEIIAIPFLFNTISLHSSKRTDMMHNHTELFMIYLSLQVSFSGKI